MAKITYSCPISIILSGAHGILYGKPALSLATNFRLSISLWQAKKKRHESQVEFIKDKVKKYLASKKIDYGEKHFDFKFRSGAPFKIPASSWQSAYFLCLVASLLTLYTGKKFEPELINNLAYQIVKEKDESFGLLISTSCFGGILYFRKEFEFLKNISQLSFKIPKKREDNLYLIDTGKPEESEKEMISQLGNDYNGDPKKTESTLGELEKVTRRLVVAIVSENEDFFEKTISDGQRLLEELNIVSEKTKKAIRQIKKEGTAIQTGFGGKKDGAGLVLVYTKNKKKLDIISKTHKIKYYKFNLSEEGLKFR